MYTVAGLLIAVGILWYPALIIGGIISIYVFFIMDKNIYLCKKCGNQVKPSEIHKQKST